MTPANHILSASLFNGKAIGSDVSAASADQQFSAVVQSHHALLLTVIARLTNNRQTAEDIVQDTFLKFWEKRNTVAHNNIGGWLYRVACNLAYKNAKRESVRSRIHSVFQADSKYAVNEAEEKLLQKENKGLLRDTTNRLPEQQLAVFRLSSVEGLSRNEIAHCLNISPNTVRNHLARATRFIKENMQCACLIFFFSAVTYVFFNSGGTKINLRDFIEVQGKVNRNVLTEMNHRNEFGTVVTGYTVLPDQWIRKNG